MTSERKEAIKQLKWYFEEDDGTGAGPNVKKAYEVALEALKEEPRHNPITNADKIRQMTRENARDWMIALRANYRDDGIIADAFTIAIEALEQPEQKKGKWIEKTDPYGFFESIPVCSECGCTTKYREKYKCCPNCGAEMEGQDG